MSHATVSNQRFRNRFGNHLSSRRIGPVSCCYTPAAPIYMELTSLLSTCDDAVPALPPQVECRLSIGSKGLTNTKVNFQYFSVGDATKTVAFGPGLLHGMAPGVPVVFIIQARDKVNYLYVHILPGGLMLRGNYSSRTLILTSNDLV